MPYLTYSFERLNSRRTNAKHPPVHLPNRSNCHQKIVRKSSKNGCLAQSWRQIYPRASWEHSGTAQECPRATWERPRSVPGAFLSVPKASPERPSRIPEPPESPKNPPEAILPRFQLAQGRSWGASGPSPERFFMTFFAHPFVFCIHANGAGNATQQDVAAHRCRSQIALPQRLFHNDLFQPSHRDDSCCWLFVVASSFFVHCTKAL